MGCDGDTLGGPDVGGTAWLGERQQVEGRGLAEGGAGGAPSSGLTGPRWESSGSMQAGREQSPWKTLEEAEKKRSWRLRREERAGLGKWLLKTQLQEKILTQFLLAVVPVAVRECVLVTPEQCLPPIPPSPRTPSLPLAMTFDPEACQGAVAASCPLVTLGQLPRSAPVPPHRLAAVVGGWMGSGSYFRENMGLTLQTCPFYWKSPPSVSLQPPPGSLSLAPLSAG